ncbi:5'-nucleotidase domain-containing protein 2 isoform X2 [Xenopus tropicalis]|uniref:5'-nucleotidase domain containing 2 n=1 Tax=Xenopus tropicalis TaxID=8364 RepID=A0A803JDX0_XENTR|nr:5'-nucleotidase domain-containing protein 2 isoform X2 [Xenopus tropicalis]
MASLCRRFGFHFPCTKGRTERGILSALWHSPLVPRAQLATQDAGTGQDQPMTEGHSPLVPRAQLATQDAGTGQDQPMTEGQSPLVPRAQLATQDAGTGQDQPMTEGHSPLVPRAQLATQDAGTGQDQPMTEGHSPLVPRAQLATQDAGTGQDQPMTEGHSPLVPRAQLATQDAGTGQDQPMTEGHSPLVPRAQLATQDAGTGQDHHETVGTKAQLWGRYHEMKKLIHDLLPPGVCNLLNPNMICANNEISLAEIEIYGFDYDYTLAQYSDALHHMIFSTARDLLIQHYRYPEGIGRYEYIPGFAIRGLHYDIQKSLLMKIDAFHYVQLGTAYRGLNPVPDEELRDLYGGTQHIPLFQMSDFYGKGPSMKQFMDVFSLPEMCLILSVTDFFISNNIEFDPVHLYKDITDSIKDVHVRGLVYTWIEKDMEHRILHGDEVYAVLNRLLNHKKKLFLITNSPFSFVPFRRLDEKGALQWDKINCLEKGKIYKQGNLFEFLQLTGWRGSKVLYFGDHLYSDLADLMVRHGWRTGAIVPELEAEIRIINSEQYMHSLTWQQALTGLLERMQMHQDAESKQVLLEWLQERQELRALTKNLFNPQFGSIFRTFHNPTYFSRRLVRFSDIYMSSISCLLNYDINFTFYPRRTPLQHEAPLWMDQLCTGCMKTPFLDEMVQIR